MPGKQEFWKRKEKEKDFLVFVFDLNETRSGVQRKSGPERPEGGGGFLNNSWLQECLRSDKPPRIPFRRGRIVSSRSPPTETLFRFVSFNCSVNDDGQPPPPPPLPPFTSPPPPFPHYRRNLQPNWNHWRHEIRRSNRNLCRNNKTGRLRFGGREGGGTVGRRGPAFRKCRRVRTNPFHESEPIYFFDPGTLKEGKNPGNVGKRGKKKEKRLKTFRAKVLFPEVFKDLAQ